MGAVRRQSARISDNVKIKKTPLKVQDKKASTSRRGRSALADKTNQQEPKKVKEQVLDERTSKRRSKRTFEGEVDHQREEKKGKKTEEVEEEGSTEQKAINDILEGEVKEEVKVEVIEEPKAMKREDKKWDPLAGLSDYEKIRLENIRQREALFAELELAEAKAAVTPLSSTLPARTHRSAPSRRGLPTPKREKEELLPRRHSSRLKEGVNEIRRFNAGVDDIEGKPKKIKPRSFPAETPRAPATAPSRRGLQKDSKEQVAKLQMVKGEREGWQVPLHPLSLEECGAADSASLLASLAAEKPSVSKSSSLATISNLAITPERVAKVVPDRIFSVAFHPGGEKLVAGAGDKWGKVGLWDCLDNESETHGVHLFHYHSRPVNCLTWDAHCSHRLISTAYDGTSRQLDAENQKASLLFHDPEFLESGGWASFHCQDSANTFLITLGNHGSVVKVDTRVGVLPVATYHLLDKSHAKSISCHPLQPHLLLTGTNKGGCSIFDLRSSPASNGLLVPATSLLGATRSLSSCQFSPSGSQVVTMASDDKLRLYSTRMPAPSLQPVAQVRHDNYTGRWLTPFRASWHPTRDDLLVTGSMERPRQMEVWRTGGDKLTLEGLLRGEELSSVASVLAIHPTRDAVVGGNSSGRLHLFM